MRSPSVRETTLPQAQVTSVRQGESTYAVNMDMLRLKEHTLLAALLLLACALASSGAAQPTPPGESYDYTAGAGSQQPPQQDMTVSTTMIALLAGAVAVFVFIALSIIYLRHCTSYYDNADRSTVPGALDASTFISRRLQHRQQQRGTATTRGLDKEVVEAFPTMRYAEAKALRVGKTQALECAVCLSEFEDEEKLRLLPRCSHAFHPDCIGAWLASHVTCPVCRRNLDPSKDPGSDDEPSLILPPPPAAAEEASNTHSHSTSSEIAAVVAVRGQNDGDVAIDVASELDEEEAEQRRKEALELQRIGTQQRRAMRSRSNKKARLVRSHSTGHDSLAAAGRDDMERFTLRLPEHVRREMMAAASSWDQLSSTRRGQKSGGGVSASSRRGAARWPSFFACTRTWSGRLPVFLPISRRATEQSSDGGEVSSSSSSRIRGKRVAAVDVVNSGAFALGATDRIAAAGGGGKVGSVAVDVDSKATSRQVRT